MVKLNMLKKAPKIKENELRVSWIENGILCIVDFEPGKLHESIKTVCKKHILEGGFDA